METEGSLQRLLKPATSPFPEPDQSTPCHYPTFWRLIYVLLFHLLLVLPSGLFPSDFPTKTIHAPLPSPIHATYPSHLFLYYMITRTERIIKLLVM